MLGCNLSIFINLNNLQPKAIVTLAPYNTEFVAGSLLIPESRTIATLLLKGDDESTFKHKILVENVLQKRSPTSAKRQSNLICNRLAYLHPQLLMLVAEGSRDQTVQLLLAASIMQNHLLGDFIQEIADCKRNFKQQITYRDWDLFFEQCKQIDNRIESWSETTTQKVRQVVFRILAEAQIIDSTRKKQLLPFYLLPEIKKLLEKYNLSYALKCLEI